MFNLTSSAGRPNVITEIQAMQPAIKRFAGILQALIRVYNVPMTSVQIFHDLSGPLIAFNRSGSLYVNLRYYIAWHDEVSTGGESIYRLLNLT